MSSLGLTGLIPISAASANTASASILPPVASSSAMMFIPRPPGVSQDSEVGASANGGFGGHIKRFVPVAPAASEESAAEKQEADESAAGESILGNDGSEAGLPGIGAKHSAGEADSPPEAKRPKAVEEKDAGAPAANG